MEKQRRRDVVRQVADQTQILADRGEIKIQRIAFVDGHPFRRVLFFQTGDQVAVDFDDMQMIQARHQRLGNRPQTGANLDEYLVFLRPDGGNNGSDDAAINEKILPKAFAGDVFFHAGQTFLAAIRAASATASKRLPGSARPLPAKASAVP